MNNLTFGLTLLVVGMGGTLVVLWLLTLAIRGLTTLFPASKDSTTPKP
jgi:Na+-transporting methylmalonyl-CoA/oxaloacetate decarboxylase gamma subunit